MKKNLIAPHSDGNLNLLRLLALGAVGVYFYKTYKDEGSLMGATGKTHLSINQDQLIDSVVNLTGLDENHKSLLKIGAKKLMEGI